MGIETSGFRELNYDLEKIMEGLDEASVAEALQNGAKPIHEKIVENTPVRRGILKKAMTVGKIKKVNGRWKITIGSHKAGGAPHAHLVELGHGGPHPAPAHPFMRTAFDASVDEGYAAVRDTIKTKTGG